MKKMNQDVREADDVLYALNANAPVSMQDRRARLDPELDQYCKMLQDRRVCREQEHWMMKYLAGWESGRLSEVYPQFWGKHLDQCWAQND